MANEYDFDARGYPPQWLPPTTPQSLYGNGAWNAFVAMLGNDPNASGRFGAMSNGPSAQAWNDRRAAGSEVTNWPGASAAVDTSKPAMFTLAELYGLGLRPHHAPETFGALERLADGVPTAAGAGSDMRGLAGSTAADAPQAFTLADVEAERRKLGEIALTRWRRQSPTANSATL